MAPLLWPDFPVMREFGLFRFVVAGGTHKKSSNQRALGEGELFFIFPRQDEKLQHTKLIRHDNADFM